MQQCKTEIDFACSNKLHILHISRNSFQELPEVAHFQIVLLRSGLRSAVIRAITRTG